MNVKTVMLADSIDGGILALLVMFCGLAAALLALAGLVPALRGNKPATILLVLPALLAGMAITCWVFGSFLKDGGANDPEYNPFPDLIMTWIFLSGAPFGTALLSIFVLWYKRRKQAQRLVREPQQ